MVCKRTLWQRTGNVYPLDNFHDLLQVIKSPVFNVIQSPSLGNYFTIFLRQFVDQLDSHSLIDVRQQNVTDWILNIWWDQLERESYYWQWISLTNTEHLQSTANWGLKMSEVMTTEPNIELQDEKGGVILNNVLIPVLVVCCVTIVCFIILTFVILYQNHMAKKKESEEVCFQHRHHRMTTVGWNWAKQNSYIFWRMSCKVKTFEQSWTTSTRATNTHINSHFNDDR